MARTLGPIPVPHRQNPIATPSRQTSTAARDIAASQPFGPQLGSSRLARKCDGCETAGRADLVRDTLTAHGQPLSAQSREFFEPRLGCDLGGVRLHTDANAARSASAVNALAYAVGNHIVFGAGQFAPDTPSGQRLLAHELAHTVQQRGATMPPEGDLAMSQPDDFHERQADRVADSIMSANDSELIESPAAALATSPLSVARVQRVISFTTAEGNFAPHNVVANEDAAGFVLTSDPATFEWVPDVTIHGDATDVFTDWETAHHQVGKSFWFNVFWGTGANRTHRRRTINGGLPMRDATAAGNTWYSDFRAQGFAADGDVRSPVMRDTPSSGRIPWDNPIAGRAGTRGWFNYGFGFVSTVSARHIPDGTDAAAFRHLNHVHWNFMVSGQFDTTAAVGARVTLTGGTVNRSRAIPGFDVDNRPMHGGAVINDNFQTTDT